MNTIPRILGTLAATAVLLTLPTHALEVAFHVKEGKVTRDVNRAFQNVPLSGWCIVTDKAGARYYPVGTDFPGEEQPGYFYFWERFVLDLKPGVPYTIRIEKGLEWEPFEAVVELQKGQTEVDLFMDSWISLKNRRWLAADLDARFIYMDPALAMDSQGLNLVCRVVTAASAVTDEEKRSKGFNHLSNERAFTGRDWSFEDFNVLATLEDLTAGNETPFESTELDHLRKGKGLGGFVDAVNPAGRDAPIAAALGWIDFVRVVGPAKANDEVWDETRTIERFERYYDLLNAGFRVPVSAGSLATERDPNPRDRLGSSRVYARIKADFSLGGCLEVLRRGHSWATNGPALTLQVNGKDPGTDFLIRPPRKSVRISMGARSNRPLDRLELVHNGRVVDTLIGSATQDHVLKDFVFDVAEPGWIAVRAFEKPDPDRPRIGVGHTSPVYLTWPETPAFSKVAVGKLASEVEERLREVESDEEIGPEEKAQLVVWCNEALEVFRKRLAEFDEEEE